MSAARTQVKMPTPHGVLATVIAAVIGAALVLLGVVTGSGSASAAAVNNGTVVSNATCIGSGPSYTVNVSATGIKSTSGANGGTLWHGGTVISNDVNTTYTPLTSTDANGDVTFPSFTFNPAGASSVQLFIDSTTSSGGVNLPFTIQFPACTTPTFTYGSANATATCNGNTGTITATDTYTANSTDHGTHAIWLDGTDTNLLFQFQTVSGTHSDTHTYTNVSPGTHKVEFLDPSGHETDKTVVVCPVTSTPTPTPTLTPTHTNTGTPTATPTVTHTQTDTVPPTSSKVVDPTTTGTGGTLAVTGAKTASWLELGIGLLAVGAMLLLVAARRRNGLHRH